MIFPPKLTITEWTNAEWKTCSPYECVRTHSKYPGLGVSSPGAGGKLRRPLICEIDKYVFWKVIRTFLTFLLSHWMHCNNELTPLLLTFLPHLTCFQVGTLHKSLVKADSLELSDQCREVSGLTPEGLSKAEPLDRVLQQVRTSKGI